MHCASFLTIDMQLVNPIINKYTEIISKTLCCMKICLTHLKI